jgi:S1-C subfamily serine protease
VQKASLKAIARQPVLPQLNLYANPRSTSNTKAVKWKGAMLYEPHGDELSAYGVGFNEGGIALVQIDPASSLLTIGFKAGDLIQVINGVPVKNISDFLSRFNHPSSGADAYEFEIIRNQQKQKLIVKQLFQ